MGLGCLLQNIVWKETWLSFRGAKENAFLWELIFRACGTLSWQIPDRPHTDPSVWCPRCNQGVREDHRYCIWHCPLSSRCWRWCEALLTLVSRPQLHFTLLPSHVIFAAALPEDCEIPLKLWRIVRAVLCWLIWKEKNTCVFTAKVADPEKVI